MVEELLEGPEISAIGFVDGAEFGVNRRDGASVHRSLGAPSRAVSRELANHNSQM